MVSNWDNLLHCLFIEFAHHMFSRFFFEFFEYLWSNFFLLNKQLPISAFLFILTEIENFYLVEKLNKEYLVK